MQKAEFKKPKTTSIKSSLRDCLYSHQFMKLIPSLSQRLSFAVLAICIFLAANSAAQNFKTVHDGVEYAEVTRELSDKQPVKINLLRIDLTKVRLDVHHALDKAIGVETTSSIATRHGAVAAVNAGFFRLDKSLFAGEAAALLKIDGKALSENTNGRVSIGIVNGKKKTETCFAHVQSFLFIRKELDLAMISVTGINRERKPNETIIYTPEFGKSTLTSPEGSEFLIKSVNNGPGGYVIELRENAGNSSIPPDGFVISIAAHSPEKRFDKKTKIVSWGHLAEADGGCRNFFYKSEDIVAGVPQLIKNGKIDITWEQEKASKAFVETRHPRTAVAKLKDGKFLMMTIDGRQPGVSVGMNLYELADYLLSLGAVDAMNLDGGGSTTMFLDGKVVNKPSDKEGERKVGDAILVTLRNKRSSPKKPKK